jgi:alpha-D-xyloside xylohydrolase
MKYFLRTLTGVLFLIFVEDVSAQVEKLNDGVLIHLPGSNGRSIKLEVVSDKIIHVIKSPVEAFQKDTSLMVVGGNKKMAWLVDTKRNETTLSTAVLRVIVDLSTGATKFHDLKRQTLLEEDKNGSSFVATKIDSGPSWQIKQTFLSPGNEAFYGLGQHQQGIMNYKV